MSINREIDKSVLKIMTIQEEDNYKNVSNNKKRI